jgi:hypothetical protein
MKKRHVLLISVLTIVIVGVVAPITFAIWSESNRYGGHARHNMDVAQRGQAFGLHEARNESSFNPFARRHSDEAPGISVNAAPGVAFDYRYAFRLPNNKIATIQEKHAQMCEKLGLDKCRITGMKYQLVDETNVRAYLIFKLDPTLARQFGKDAIASVKEAEGMLVESEITGVDAQDNIERAEKSIARLKETIAQLERRERSASNETEKLQIREQIEELKRQIGTMDDGKDAAVESLATTPMVFNYGSGSLISGFDDSSPVLDAFRTAWGILMMLLSALIIGLSLVVPIGLFGWLCYRAYRRFIGDSAVEAPVDPVREEAEPTPAPTRNARKPKVDEGAS